MPGDITELLLAQRDGQAGALSKLMPAVYGDLRRIARAQMRGRRPGATLDTGALVHEAYLRLVDQQRVAWNDRRHFFAVAAMAMRQIAVDHARARARQKRGGGAAPATLTDALDPLGADLDLVIAIDEALRTLEATDARLVRVVECRYFAGLSEQETAEALETSVRTVQREWYKARAWLRQHLAPAGPATDRGA
jgi:RNA polymerase sigma factor (TIGR02999 family)